MIEHDKSSADIQHYIRSLDYKDMKADALQKVLSGTSSIEEVDRIIN